MKRKEDGTIEEEADEALRRIQEAAKRGDEDARRFFKAASLVGNATVKRHGGVIVPEDDSDDVGRLRSKP